MPQSRDSLEIHHAYFHSGLAQWPTSVRILLTGFLLIVGSGYLVAVANIYQSHHMADGRSGLTMDDLRAVYSGLVRRAGQEASSRMLTMIRGAMREYVGSDSEFSVLENWLRSGGGEAGFVAGSAGATPRRVIIRNCLRCHGESTGTEVSKSAPFGADEFDADYGKLARFAATATESGASTRDGGGPLPQYTMQRLILISHVHMLSIPLFTLVVGCLYAMTRGPRRVRAAVTVLPMLALIVDFSGWWLSRLGEGGIFLIAAGGGVFGLFFGVQIIGCVIDLWRPDRPVARAAITPAPKAHP